MPERVVAEIVCVQRVTDYVRFAQAVPLSPTQGVTAMGNVHYKTGRVVLERPASGAGERSAACPVCGTEIALTVWSRKRIWASRTLCTLGLLMSVPFVIIGFGIFAVFFFLFGLLHRNRRYGLFRRGVTGILDQKWGHEIPWAGHKVTAVALLSSNAPRSLREKP